MEICLRFLSALFSAMPPRNHPWRDLDPNNFRLLRVMPSEDEAAPRRCKLCNYSLQTSNKGTHLYETLSYAWGILEKPRTISVDGFNIAVTVNLYNALSRLRDHYFERVIWADAICINQEDQEEKVAQIQMIPKIYSQAKRVIIYLGRLKTMVVIKHSRIYVLLQKACRKRFRSAKRAKGQFSNFLNDGGFGASG